MPQVIYAEANDEIIDLVDRVRSAEDGKVALVLPVGMRAAQTPLNFRLIGQMARSSNKAVFIISGDARIQELAKAGGFPTYASVQAYERGIETVRPHHDESAGIHSGGGVAVATPPQVAPARAPATVIGARAVAPDAKPPNRRPLYFAGIAVLAISILLALLFAPSAKITVTVAGQPISLTSTVNGTEDPNAAKGADKLLSAVVSDDRNSTFQATPSGQKQIAAAQATGAITFQTDFPGGATTTVLKGTTFQTSDCSITFMATQDTPVNIPAGNGTPGGYGPDSNPVPVQDSTPEAKGNVAAETITKWSGNPCGASPTAGSSDFRVHNPQPTSGGADAKTLTVASDQDVASWTQQMQQAETTLKGQSDAALKSQAGNRTIVQDSNGKGIDPTFEVNPPLPKSGDQFAPTTITVTIHNKAVVYNPGDLKNDIVADMNAQVPQGDELATDALQMTPTLTTPPAADGTFVLSVAATGYSRPTIDLEQLKSQLTGKSPGEARSIITTKIDHVQSVDISQSPIPLFWLPFFSSHLELDENFVAAPKS